MPSAESTLVTFITADEAMRRGDHNTISLLLVKMVQRTNATKGTQAIAPFFAEFFGTMMLTLVIALTAGKEVLAPLAIGGILMSMIFTYGHISGANYNPAVSLAVLVRGKITSAVFGGYVLSQLLGGICGALFAKLIVFEDSSNLVDLPLPSPSIEVWKAFLLELVFTYTLCTTVLNTATTTSIGPNSFYGLAISFVVMAGAVASGGYSGAVFNPAVAIGLYTAHGTTDGGMLWLYWIAPMMGGIISGIMFHILNSSENNNITFGNDMVVKGEEKDLVINVDGVERSADEGLV
mmetsp:Transcript_9416/g.14100  ORF Transcript_9416/g.14100 Transcript_9416/m.14100 type:complete len:293 (+) Transcript_9416:93-971(+)